MITVDNVQTLTGLTPQQYADQASAAIGQPTGYFVFGPTGLLTNVIIPAQLRPTAVADSFDTPHTLGFNVGVQHELTDDMAIAVDYFHRDIRNLLGLRTSNIAFESRVLGRRFLPPFTQGPIRTFGPFYEGTYDAVIVDFRKRFSHRFALGASYTYADATDNSLGIDVITVRQLHRHGASRHRAVDRENQRQRSVHPRQRHPRPAGRNVSERSRPRQGTVRSGDRSCAPGQRAGRAAVPDSGQRNLPGAKRVSFQPAARKPASWSIRTGTGR